MTEITDAYRTIAGPTTGDFRDRGSKFLAYAFPVFSEEEWQERLLEVKQMHPKARHHCFAWRLGLDGQLYRANDDGEPSGSAGRPILGQIDSLELTNVLVVVVRYFGGTKLGIPGLIQAYKASTADALQQAEIVERRVEELFLLVFDYHLMSPVMNTLKGEAEVQIIGQEFTDKGALRIAIRQREAQDTMVRVRAGIAGVHLEEREKWEKIEGLEVLRIGTR